MNSFLEGFETGTIACLTTNGADAYSTTMSGLMDYFGAAGALRGNSDDETIRLFNAAYADDPLAAIRLLFYFRDCRGGQGERKHFRTVMKMLANDRPNDVISIMKHIPEYGRWDDVVDLIFCGNSEIEEAAAMMIGNQLLEDETARLNNKPCSLLAKWMPSINGTKTARHRALKILKMHSKLFDQDLKESEYRKMCSALRKHIDVTERKMCTNQWDKIDYAKVPSRANILYNRAFMKHDEARRSEYLQDVSTGKTKVNASVLYPHEIVRRVWRTDDNSELKNLNNAWDALPDFIGETGEKSIAVVDVSGSMTCMNGLPLDVSVSLGLYFAERNAGPFKDRFITFSAKPSLLKIAGNTLAEKVRSINSAQWGMNTNIAAVFKLILKAAETADPEDVPTRIYIISDMQFDYCVQNHDGSLMQSIAKDFEAEGIKMPQLVFWNVNYSGNVQMTKNDNGWIMISGFSPSVLKYVMAMPADEDIDNFTMQLISDIVNSERYSSISI